MTNSISWFQIPANNYERAKAFYSEVLGAEITDVPMPDARYGIFPFDKENNGVGGAIKELKDLDIQTEGGALVYLNTGDDLSGPLSRVEEAGGKIVMPKTPVGNTFMALIIDTEGNKVGLSSLN